MADLRLRTHPCDGPPLGAFSQTACLALHPSPLTAGKSPIPAARSQPLDLLVIDGLRFSSRYPPRPVLCNRTATVTYHTVGMRRRSDDSGTRPEQEDSPLYEHFSCSRVINPGCRVCAYSVARSGDRRRCARSSLSRGVVCICGGAKCPHQPSFSGGFGAACS